MKNPQVLPFFIRSLLLSIVGLLNIQSIALAQNQFSKPGTSMLYISSFNPTQPWQFLSTTHYSYNSMGLITQTLTTDSTNKNGSKKVISYDNFGNETVIVESVWRNNAWQDFHYRNQYNYDANNRVLSKTRQYLTNGIWENEYRTLTTYTNNLISEIIFQHYDSSTNAWIDISKEFDFTWYIPNQKASAYRSQFKQNNAWTDGSRFSAVYDIHGGSITNQEIWNNNSWVNYARIVLTNDPSGNEVNYLSERWLNGNWNFYLQNSKPITYTPNGDILEQYSDITCISCTPGPPSKKVYSNFQYFNVTGIKNEIFQIISTNVFPNPAENILNIEIQENCKTLTAQLLDLTGKVILNQHFKASEQKQLHLEILPKGIYLLSLETDKGKTVRKIVKN